MRPPLIHVAAFSRGAASLAPSCLPRVDSFAALGAAGEALAALVSAACSLLVITGAGISTESGIPDYRSPGRAAYRPLNHAQFVGQEATRRRYWARSTIGFPRMREAAPNTAHAALAALERAGLLAGGLITQNVDRLHQAAGQAAVLELHGTIHEVACMQCGACVTRAAMQLALEAANGGWLARHAAAGGAAPRPDGDVELGEEAYASFVIPPCPTCGGGMLKPSVIFHGGTVEPAVAASAARLAASADAVLILGSTVTTFSAFRLVRDAHGRGARVGIVTYGPTRADPLAHVKVEASVGDTLAALAAHLGVRVPPVARAAGGEGGGEGGRAAMSLKNATM
jgi:NAD-dependent deacetylase sirtuin 4